MRLQLASLIAAAGVIGLAANATAQEATTPPPPPPPAATPPVPAPTAPAGPMAQPAAPATAPAPAPAPAPTDAAAPPAAPGTAPADTTETPAPQTLPIPTSGDGYLVIQILEKVCEPGVKTGKLDDLAKAYGFKKSRNGPWTMTLGTKPYLVSIDPYSGANPTVCNVTLDFATGGSQAIVDGLNAWAYNHEPFMKLYRNDEYANTGFIGRTISWEHQDDNDGRTSLVYVGKKKPDGTPYSKVGDQATMLFQILKGS